MKIRKTTLQDLPEVMQIYAQARVFMVQTGNPHQWPEGYPGEELIREDIACGISYVAEADGEIETVFLYFEGDDPMYQRIEDGAWKNEAAYGVIHRIASRGRVKGAGSFCLQWGFARCGNLRMDTHDDNSVMQHVLEKNGFERCGRVYTETGSPRIAYQKVR